jgi:hypothetical protein
VVGYNKSADVIQAVSRWLPTAGPRVRVRLGFVVDKLELGQVLSEYFGFLCNSFHLQLHNHHPSSGAGTIGQILADLPSGPVSPHPQKIK